MNSLQRNPGKEFARFEYPLRPIQKGYNNRTLYVNLTKNAIKSKPVSDEMKRTFIGGKGFDLWLLWNGTREKTKWSEPENELCIACGPLGGTTLYPGSGKEKQRGRVFILDNLVSRPARRTAGKGKSLLLTFFGIKSFLPQSHFPLRILPKPLPAEGCPQNSFR